MALDLFSPTSHSVILSSQPREFKTSNVTRPKGRPRFVAGRVQAVSATTAAL